MTSIAPDLSDRGFGIMIEKKKAGGIFAIEDEDLKWRILLASSNNEPCASIRDLMEKVFKHELDGGGVKGDKFYRYVVCPLPGSYKFDLENIEGSASPADAAQSYIELLVSGWSLFVWDRVTKTMNFFCANEHIYKPMDDARNPTNTDILESFDIERLQELRKLIDKKLEDVIDDQG